MHHRARQKHLEARSLSATTVQEKGVVIKMCFGTNIEAWGMTLNIDVTKTCFTIDLDKIKNFFETIAVEIWNFIKNDIVGKAGTFLKEKWGDLTTYVSSFFKNGLKK